MAKKTAVIPPLTREEVHAICRGWRTAGRGGIGETIRGAFSQKLSGRKIDLVFDNFSNLTYRIESGEMVRWSQDGRDYKDEYAQILELETSPGIFLINHLRSGTFPLENVTLVIDFETGLATLALARLGNGPRPRDVERAFYFGEVKSGCNSNKRHSYTTELVGKIIDWYYDKENGFAVKHLYINNEHMVYLLLESHVKEKGLVEAAECDYIKIREGVYVMSWLEKGHQGMQGLVLMDINSMHDVGSFFGINIDNKLDNYTFAANGKFSDLGRQII